jgi:hypothetical protein
MSSTASLKWIGLALLGIAIAAAVAIAASNLISRQIGLASEPISAGEALAPALGARGGHDSSRSGSTAGQTKHSPPATKPTNPESPPETSPTTPTAPATNGDGSHGQSDDSGGSHDADD